MTLDRWLAVAAVVAFLGGVYLAGWVHYRCPRWFLGCVCMDPQDLPSPAEEATRTSPGQAALGGSWAGEFDDDWAEPYTDADADQLIRDLTTDLPGPDSMPAPWAGEHHERAYSPALVESLTDDPDLLLWDIRCQVTRIQEIRGELADLKRELCAA